MEKFVYICNESELIKLIEAFGENLQVDDSFFYNSFVYAIQKEDAGKNYNYKDELFKEGENDNKINDITDFALKIADKTKLNTTDIIYISIHPGGTNEKEIKDGLGKINETLNSPDKQKIFFTYHGSQNLKVNSFWGKEKVTQEDLNNLNKAAKDFIQPDISYILKKYKSELLIDKRLIDEAFGVDFDCGKVKIIFDIDDCDEALINTLKEYKNNLDNALYNVNKLYKSLFKKMNKIKST